MLNSCYVNQPTGLRIAPPEAPSTGYMFGKGVYFADMFSKSANYCFTSKECSTGVLLLCEVSFLMIIFALLISVLRDFL